MSPLLSKFYSESLKQQFDFFGTIFIQLSFVSSEQELLRLFTQNIWHVCWNSFYVYRHTIWRETIFSKEWSFSYLFMTYRGKQFDQEQPCLFTVDKTAFSNSGAQFEILFQQFWNFSSILGFQYELLPYLAQKFRHSCQKSISRVQTKIWQKIGFRLQSVTVL